MPYPPLENNRTLLVVTRVGGGEGRGGEVGAMGKATRVLVRERYHNEPAGSIDFFAILHATNRSMLCGQKKELSQSLSFFVAEFHKKKARNSTNHCQRLFTHLPSNNGFAKLHEHRKRHRVLGIFGQNFKGRVDGSFISLCVFVVCHNSGKWTRVGLFFHKPKTSDSHKQTDNGLGCE